MTPRPRKLWSICAGILWAFTALLGVVIHPEHTAISFEQIAAFSAIFSLIVAVAFAQVAVWLSQRTPRHLETPNDD